MTSKSILKTALAIFALMLIFNLGAFAQRTDCSKVTDADIVKSIYDQMKVKYEYQINYVNVRITDGVVTLEGWTRTKGMRKDIEKYAKKTKCVKKVMNKLTVGIPGGCGPGTKPCGGICIPLAETCNICTARKC